MGVLGINSYSQRVTCQPTWGQLLALWSPKVRRASEGDLGCVRSLLCGYIQVQYILAAGQLVHASPFQKLFSLK